MQALIARNGAVLVEEVPTPEPDPHELLIRVTSAGINAADILQSRGHYPPPAGFDPERLGLEFAGEIVAVGSASSGFEVGQFVMGVTGGGAQAQYLTIPATACIPVPEDLDPTVAGGFPEAAFTAFDALINKAALQMGDRVLIHGALGGVGNAAVQIGTLTGAQVTAVVRSHDQDARAFSLGCHQCVTPDEVLNAGPYDVILELVSGQNLRMNLDALAVGGTIVIIGVGSSSVTEIDLRKLMAKRGTLRAATLRARSWTEKSNLAAQVAHHLLTHVSSGAYRVIVEQKFPLENGSQAYARFSQPGKFGKLILTP